MTFIEARDAAHAQHEGPNRPVYFVTAEDKVYMSLVKDELPSPEDGEVHRTTLGRIVPLWTVWQLCYGKTVICG
jgi:hypothetical protein